MTRGEMPGLCLILLLAGAAPLDAARDLGSEAVTLEDGVPSHDGLDRIYRQFAEGYRVLDAGVVADLYIEEALYLAPGRKIERGRPAIRSGFRRMFDSARERGTDLAITFRIVSRRVSDALAADVGTYTLIRARQSKEIRRARGKFVVVAERDTDGVWRFRADGYSGLEPPEEQSAPQSRQSHQQPLDDGAAVQGVIDAYHRGLLAGDSGSVIGSLGEDLLMFNGNHSGDPSRWQAHMYLAGDDLAAWPRRMIAEAGPIDNRWEFQHVDIRGDAAVATTRETGRNRFRSWEHELVTWLLGRRDGRWRIVAVFIRDVANPESE